ncbi:hypothetical protein JCGZ_12166 [Jatropha curcas]|uniref:PHD-type domain-containing protein n=1 Tax=Jatropha curcas TaxID=180498 RepID=A0A067KM46_JATCU|nr:PHD finger protein EHD3 [Jatropha curcas]KDP32874.1 hypothetical protein JCGZ_12166 [Jatropha curcas]
MGSGEGTSIGESTCEGVQYLKSEAVNTGFGNRIGNDSGNGGSGPIEGFRTYKRRKHIKSSSESKGQEDGRGSMEAASKLADETTKEPPDCPLKDHASLDGPNDLSHKQFRNFFLERICESLNDEQGGIQGCIQDALKMTVKESDTFDKDKHKCYSQAGWMPNGTHCTAKGLVDFTSNETSDESHRPVTEMCRHALVNILLSENFTLLCKLLCENFQEVKADNLISLSLINIRMKDGVYERSPFLFCTDIQRVWRKFQGIGLELMSLGKSLSDLSLTCFNEQFRNPESYFHGKLEQFCTCRHCGGKADGRDCLVCDSCEEMYHVSCIQPAVKEIPLKSWYCASCTAVGMGSPHENCVVCKRLNAPRALCNDTDDEMKYATIERTFSKFEETSNCSRDDFRQPPVGNKSSCVCKICGSEVENGEKVKICEHNGCPYKYYHVRCLTTNLLKSYGPRWYCSSCLCRVCLLDRDDHQIVLCDGCDHAFHLYCLNPPRTSVPRGKWFCRQCDVKIKEIRRVKKAYEKQGNRMKRKDEMGRSACENLGKKLDVNCDQESDKDREPMEMLVKAALNFEEKMPGIRNT